MEAKASQLSLASIETAPTCAGALEKIEMAILVILVGLYHPPPPTPFLPFPPARTHAHLIDYREFPDVDVHFGLDRQLPCGLQDGHARRHGTSAACACSQGGSERAARTAGIGPKRAHPCQRVAQCLHANKRQGQHVATDTWFELVRGARKTKTRQRGLLNASCTAAKRLGA